jgi:protease I
LVAHEREETVARIAMLLDDMFEDSEFRIPYDRLRKAGHEVVVVGKEAGKQVTGKQGKEKIATDRASGDVSADEFDAVVIPGGYSPDHLRTDIKLVGLTRETYLRGKPLAAVCHGPWMLVEADVADGHTLTSWPSIKTDLINAGARWVDREVVEDANLITSRNPGDLEAFSDAILRQLEGRVPGRASTKGPDAASERPPLH